MADFYSFDEVYSFDKEYAYPIRVSDQILFNRRNLEGKLFFDRLLALLHIEHGTKLYPPRTNGDLRRLHEKIMASTWPDHHKQSLLYYLLLDCRGTHDWAEGFAQSSHLPEKYVTCMKGLWLMDRMQFQAALDYLTQPSLIPTFPEDILLILARHVPDNDPTLALAYYYTVSPVLTSLKPLEALFSAVCRVSVTEAFYFSRRQAESTQKYLFEQLISYVLSGSRGEVRAEKSLELVNLPFSEQEESWFEEFLETGKGKMLHGAKDTVMIRRIGSGKFKEALGDGKGPSGRKIDGLNWEALKLGISDGLASRRTEERWAKG